MLEAFTNPRKRGLTFILLAVCAGLAFGAAAVGIDDNPPGLALAYLAALVFTLAFAHPWRETKPFRTLLYGSVLGFFALTLLHSGFNALAAKAGDGGLLGGISEACFYLAFFLCPAGVVVGAVGIVIMFRKRYGGK